MTMPDEKGFTRALMSSSALQNNILWRAYGHAGETRRTCPPVAIASIHGPGGTMGPRLGQSPGRPGHEARHAKVSRRTGQAGGTTCVSFSVGNPLAGTTGSSIFHHFPVNESIPPAPSLYSGTLSGCGESLLAEQIIWGGWAKPFLKKTGNGPGKTKCSISKMTPGPFSQTVLR